MPGPYVNNYTVGKGRLYFDQFVLGTNTPQGFRYFGSTPTLTITRTVTSLDHYDSEEGTKQKDDAIDLQTDVGGKFTCDNINSDNLAAWFGGTKTIITQAATSGSALSETINVLPDHYYQLGVTAGIPEGLRAMDPTGANFTVTLGSAPLVANTDYSVDVTTGFLYIYPSTSVGSGGAVTVTYKLIADTQEVVIEQGTTIFGALKFLSANPKGTQRDYYYPKVILRPDADFALKGDTWQSVGFAYEALRIDDQTRRAFVTTR
jgi:hypothetical protein